MADQTPRDEAKALYDQMTVADLQADLGERNLTKTGVKDELVARLLDADFPQAPPAEATPPDKGALSANEARAELGHAPIEPPAEEDPVEDGELCGNCWPDGWPTPDTNNASCQHGTWDR